MDRDAVSPDALHTIEGAAADVRCADAPDRARQAYARRAWRVAHELFAQADAESLLTPDDLERYARTAVLTGGDEEYVDVLARASQLWANQSDPARAAECACYLAMNLSFRGEWGAATGWLRRAQEYVDVVGGECPATSWLLGMTAIQRLTAGEATAARHLFEDALAVARRCADANASAMAALGIGQSLVSMGKVAQGLSYLDEVMVSVVANELNPIVTGIVYCAVIGNCHEGYDARRAAEWTRALTRWCEAQPDLVPFRGQCLVHRAQIMQLEGRWPDAMEQLRQAREQLSRLPGSPAIGAAHYEQAELHRLRGDFSQAEQAYELAGGFGHETQPGRALLRLAQGRLDQAGTGIARALAETDGPLRPRLLAAGVEVALAADDVPTARRHADELAQIAAARDSLQLTAMSAQASGWLLMASGQAGRALPVLRRAGGAWRELDAPYFVARVRAVLGRACRELGDLDAARTEFEAARSTFARLGARPDLQLLREWGAGPGSVTSNPSGLSAREVEVLRQVASGKTNRAIASELVLSEKTVARHISNVFSKIGVSSRAAATAYAYEHDLVQGGGA